MEFRQTFFSISCVNKRKKVTLHKSMVKPIFTKYKPLMPILYEGST